MEGFDLDAALQLGALGLLGYIIVWVTRFGAPKLFEALDGIRSAITDNSECIRQMQIKLDRQSELLIRLVERQDKIGEATMGVVDNLKKSSGS